MAASGAKANRNRVLEPLAAAGMRASKIAPPSPASLGNAAVNGSAPGRNGRPNGRSIPIRLSRNCLFSKRNWRRKPGRRKTIRTVEHFFPDPPARGDWARQSAGRERAPSEPEAAAVFPPPVSGAGTDRQVWSWLGHEETPSWFAVTLPDRRVSPRRAFSSKRRRMKSFVRLTPRHSGIPSCVRASP